MRPRTPAPALGFLKPASRSLAGLLLPRGHFIAYVCFEKCKGLLQVPVLMCCVFQFCVSIMTEERCAPGFEADDIGALFGLKV